MEVEGYCIDPSACGTVKVRENKCRGCGFNHVENAEEVLNRTKKHFPRKVEVDGS